MKLGRRYQVLPSYAYCTECDWTDTCTSRRAQEAQDQASVHVARENHTVRVVMGSELRLSPPPPVPLDTPEEQAARRQVLAVSA